MVSDGTIRLLSLLTGLLVKRDEPSTLFIEEPERSLHPLVLQQVVELMRTVSADIQIIVTTHNPEFVRHCMPDEVFLVDKVDGLTSVEPAKNVENIERFLETFSLDELWTMGYLERALPW